MEAASEKANSRGFQRSQSRLYQRPWSVCVRTENIRAVLLQEFCGQERAIDNKFQKQSESQDFRKILNTEFQIRVNPTCGSKY